MVMKVAPGTGAAEVVGPPASALCARPGWSSTSWQELDGWTRAQCNCASGTYGPYCMPIPHTISSYVHYTPRHTLRRTLSISLVAVGVAFALVLSFGLLCCSLGAATAERSSNNPIWFLSRKGTSVCTVAANWAPSLCLCTAGRTHEFPCRFTAIVRSLCFRSITPSAP
ncbi:hypothetical protein STCU_12220 [Strigomonas culicis]|uniref:EGF-like domain-containing protein n=1 Tax=Strigomonas culicis TaxID=28005 RepID=S9TFW8_9TRYP|nr:hypothetical protein STCU_12220 [Strigomonas culicis]|eukprot:EPY15233.1 hypothetical protein STCU_12220 [Strigomonas culicis]